MYIDIDIHHGDGVEEAFYTTHRWGFDNSFHTLCFSVYFFCISIHICPNLYCPNVPSEWWQYHFINSGISFLGQEMWLTLGRPVESTTQSMSHWMTEFRTNNSSTSSAQSSPKRSKFIDRELLFCNAAPIQSTVRKSSNSRPQRPFRIPHKSLYHHVLYAPTDFAIRSPVHTTCCIRLTFILFQVTGWVNSPWVSKDTPNASDMSSLSTFRWLY